MKRATTKKIDQAVSLIYEMMSDGHSLIYSKFVVARKCGIPASKLNKFQKSESYLAMKKHFALKKQDKKRFVKVS